MKNVTPEDPEIHWNEWSAPKEAGGRKASKFSLEFRKKNGTVGEIIHKMDLTESRFSFVKLASATAPGTFVPGDYTVGAIAHYNKEDGTYDGASEVAEFNVTFPAAKPNNASNPTPAPANSGTSSPVAPPPPCAPQSEVDEVISKLKGITQVLTKSALSQADKDGVVADLQFIRDKADTFLILFPGTDVAPFRDEANRLENEMMNKTAAATATPPTNQSQTQSSTAGTPPSQSANQPAAGAAGNPPTTGTTANQPAANPANQPAAGTAANQPATATRTAANQPAANQPAATPQANWFMRYWRRIAIGVGIAILTYLIGWSAKWYFIHRNAPASTANTVNPAINKLQDEISSKASEIAETERKIADLKIAKLTEDLAKLKAALEQQQSAATNQAVKSANNSVANNSEVKIRDIKDTKGNLLVQSQVNIYHAASKAADRNDLFEGSDNQAIRGVVSGRTNIVVFDLTPEEIAGTVRKFCFRKTLGPGDYGLIVAPLGGWEVNCWRSLDEKDIVTMHDERPARNITPGRQLGPVEQGVRETRIYPKPGHPYCEVEVTFERPTS